MKNKNPVFKNLKNNKASTHRDKKNDYSRADGKRQLFDELKQGLTENKSLIETNPYLRNPILRKAYNLQSVISNFGVEGMKVSKSLLKAAKEAVIYAREYKSLLKAGLSKEEALKAVENSMASKP